MIRLVLIAVWEAGSGNLVWTFSYPATAIGSACFRPMAGCSPCGDIRGVVTVWTLPDGTPFATLSAGESPSSAWPLAEILE